MLADQRENTPKHLAELYPGAKAAAALLKEGTHLSLEHTQVVRWRDWQAACWGKRERSN